MAYENRKSNSRANQIACTTVLLGMSLLIADGTFASDSGTFVPAPRSAVSGSSEAKQVRWKFVPKSKRDPFTFMRKSIGDKEGGGSSGTPPVPYEALRHSASQAYSLGQAALLEGLTGVAIEQSAQALSALRDVPNLSANRELLELRERLTRLWKAASRLKARQDADKEFAALELKISGIVSRERKSLAVVNGKVSNRGDVVATTSEGSHVVIDEIRADQVVFMYKTYRMSLPLSDGLAAR